MKAAAALESLREVLRAENRENAFAGFVDDLRAVAKRLEPPKKVRKA